MPLFPLFVDLKGKRCVVVGGGEVAARKIETLLEFEPQIVVVSPQVTDRIQDLKWGGRVVVIKKKYSTGDLEGAFMAIAATSDRAVNEQVYTDAAADNIHVNIADDGEKSTFTFPSVINRGEVVIGITTSGRFPALSKHIRESIEKVIPDSYSRMMDTLKACRERVKREISDPGVRREILGRILDEVVFYGDAVTDERLKQRIEEIFGEYINEKDN